MSDVQAGGGLETSAVDSVIERLGSKPMPSLGEAAVKGTAVESGEVAITPQADPTEPVAESAQQVTDQIADGTEPPPVEAAPETPAATLEIVETDENGETVLRARDPKTGQFSEMDQTRTYELSIKDKATGETKLYQKSLPELMRLAKDGISTQKFQNEVKQASEELTYYRQNVPQWQAEQQRIAQEAEGYKALALELLTASEDRVVTRREEYAAQNTPEQKLARIQAEMDAMQRRFASEQQSFQVRQQVETSVARIRPAITEVETLVGKDAAAGKLMLGTAHLMQNGQIPPHKFPELIAYVEGPYRQWANEEAARQKSIAAEATKLAEAARLAQANAQKAVNTTGRTAVPVGAAGSPSRPPARDTNEMIERIALGRNRGG